VSKSLLYKGELPWVIGAVLFLIGAVVLLVYVNVYEHPQKQAAKISPKPLAKHQAKAIPRPHPSK